MLDDGSSLDEIDLFVERPFAFRLPLENYLCFVDNMCITDAFLYS